MKKTFKPANRRQREVRWFVFTHRTPVALLIFILLIILILPVFQTDGEMGWEIKSKIRIKSDEAPSAHAPRTTHHVLHV